MDFANRGNRPMQQQQPAPQMGGDNFGPSTPTPTQTPEKVAKAKDRVKGLDFGKISSMFVVFAVALVAIVLIIGLVFGSDGVAQKDESDQIMTDKYQAVFLDSQDGQVYFGKLGVYNKDLYVLTDIYYVRVENPVQPEGQNQQQQASISLAKLGNELHGPEDVMFISRDKVLFWENLKDDGQVVKAITDYKANGGSSSNNSNSTSNGSSNAAGTEEETTTPQQTPTQP